MAQSSKLGNPNSSALAMASDGIVSDNRQESMASDGLFGEVDPVPFVGESKAVARATLGVISTSKALSMASLGIFGVSSPTPPAPALKPIGSRGMAVNVGRLMS